MSSPPSSSPVPLYTGANPARPPRALSSQIIQAVAALVLLVLLGISGVQIYRQIAASVAAASQPQPYSVTVPGPCPDSSNGIWTNATRGRLPVTVTCSSERLIVSMRQTSNIIAEIQFDGEVGTPFPTHYSASVLVNFTAIHHGCAGLLVHPNTIQVSSAFLLCGNGTWALKSYNVARSPSTLKTGPLPKGAGLQAKVTAVDTGNAISFQINSTDVYTQNAVKPLQRRPYVSLVMNVGADTKTTDVASFSAFTFTPLA
jgi:hypothetical protein